MPFPGAKMYYLVQNLDQPISLTTNSISFSGMQYSIQVNRIAHHHRKNRYRAIRERARRKTEEKRTTAGMQEKRARNTAVMYSIGERKDEI